MYVPICSSQCTLGSAYLSMYVCVCVYVGGGCVYVVQWNSSGYPQSEIRALLDVIQSALQGVLIFWLGI